jgi:hypothetical protein
MAKYSLINRPGALLASQANARMTILLEDLQTTAIQSKGDLLGAVSVVFQDFYAGLGQPLSSPMLFIGLPIADEWNNYQRLVNADIEILYEQMNQVRSAIQTSYAFESASMNLLSDAVNTLLNRVANFNAVSPTRSGLQQWQLSDSFLDTSKVDTASTNGAIVVNGFVEIATSSQTDHSKDATLFIDDEYVNDVLYGNPDATAIGSGSSNGFVGALHEVTVVENTNSINSTNTDTAIVQAVQLNAPAGETITFIGDVSGLHADISVVLDNNPDTWFEYEVCNVPDAFKVNPTLGYGFTIGVPTESGSSQQVPWFAFHQPNQTAPIAGSIFPAPPSTTQLNPILPDVNAIGSFNGPGGLSSDPTSISSLNLPGSAGSITLLAGGAPQFGGVLQLVLTGSFQTPTTLTQISVLPYVIHNTRLVVQSVQVQEANSSTWFSATPLRMVTSTSLLNITSSDINLDVADIWTIPAIEVAYFRIVLQQPQSYATDIGHLTWVEQVNTQTADPSILSSLLGNTIPSGQGTLPSVIYDRIDGPNPELSMALQNPGSVLATIPSFDSQVPGIVDNSVTVIGPVVEVFSGWRYAIGVRDISFTAVTYQQSGLFVTKDFTAPIDIKQVGLDVTELVPSIQASTSGFSWIKYEFSVNGGATWYPIEPISRYITQSTAPRVYVLNPTTGITAPSVNSTTVQTQGYDPIANPVTQIKMRATLSCSPGQLTATPRIQAYTLNLEGNPL